MIREIQAKTVLQKSKLPKSSHCLNPYVGCLHNCVYCYARFMRRFTGHSESWGSFVDVKVNTPEILAQQLKQTKVDGSVLVGSVCDAYQPIEKRYGLTRECIRQLSEHNISFSVLTKSSLVLRDLDIIKDAGKNVSIGISLSTLDDSIRRKFEPGASSVQQRLKTLEELYKNNISTYVFIGPILPYITDVTALIEATSPFVDAVWAESLNMRCGIREKLSEKYTLCKLLVDWQTLVCDKNYWSDMAHKVEQACHQANCELVGFYKH